ncbi:MAG: hypothetical protein E6J58_03295 [Deltaproteobacteria bacterium]|nr:MAG: hypothetical protein E6J58_03295 [Deltaproteobacteria bacterium]
MPVIPEPSGFFATGTTAVRRPPPGSTSGCQPLHAGALRRVGRLVASHRVQVESVQPTFVPAVVLVVEDHPVALRHVDGLDDVDVGRVFDHAALVARRQRDVLDDGVVRVLRIDLAVRGADQLLELADGAEARAAEGGPLDAGDDDAGDARLRRSGGGKQGAKDRDRSSTNHGVSFCGERGARSIRHDT